MAGLLYRLGRFAARRAWLVIVSWIVVLGLAGGAFALFGGTLSNAVTIPGTATQKVSDQLAEKFPAASGGSGQVIFQTTDDQPFTDGQIQAIGDTLAEAGKVDGVTGVTDPFVTTAQLADARAQVEAGKTQIAEAQAKIDAGTAQLDAAEAQLNAGAAQGLPQAQVDAGLAQLEEQRAQLTAGQDELDTQAAQATQGADLLALSDGIRQVSEDETTAIAVLQFETAMPSVPTEIKDAVIDILEGAHIDGVSLLISSDISQAIPKVFGVGELIGLIIAALVLFIMLGTFVGAGLPLISALIGVGVGALATLALSGSIEMLSVTPMLGLMLGLAVGIDYSLFIIHRHRMQLRRGMAVEDSIGLANGTSGNAVVFAGATVLIALLGLNVVGIPFLGLMGTAGAICVLVAVLIAVTLTPAMLSLLGTRLLPKKERTGKRVPKSSPVPTTPMKTGRAVITVIGTVIVLLIIAIPALSMRLGLNTATAEPEDSAAFQAYSIVEDKFGPGMNSPLVVVANLDEKVTDETLVAEQVRIGTAIEATGDIVAVAPIGASEDSSLLAFQVVPEEGPSALSTEELVLELRALTVDGVKDIGVAGNASGNIDVSEALAKALPIYLAVVVVLSLIILIFVFRSILVPVTATLGFVLSLLATFGGITAIFQWGWLGDLFGVHSPGPILSFLPVILVGVLFGLAMDYQLFLVSGMREAYSHGANARLAVQRGVHAGRSVVIAAALIMISVFAGFIFAESGMIKSIGFGLAFGVLLDAFIVRLLLIPAIMHLLGNSAWWIPKWLDRILPNVDVEGASLERTHPVSESITLPEAKH